MSTQHASDAEHLASLGYKSEFKREMTLWQNFSLGFTYLSPVVGPDWSAWTARVLIKKNATTIGSRASKATTRRPRAVSRTGLEVWVLLERTAARCTGSAATAVT